jgi:hypothetical protein
MSPITGASDYPCSNLDAVVAEQHDQNQDDDNEPDEAVAAAAIIAAAVTPIAAPAAE